MKNSKWVLRLVALTMAVVLALSCALTGLAEATDDESDNPIHVDDNPSKEETKDNDFTDQNRRDAENLIKGLEPVECWHGDQNINGVIYHELYGDGKSQEATKDISSADLFADLLTSPLSNGRNVIRDVWIHSAQAALLSGGYNKFYRVEDTYDPKTWDDAFWQWNTTACHWRGDQLFYNMPSGRGDLKHANSFDTVRDAMLQLIKDQSDRVKWQLKDGLKTYDKALKNWKAPENTGGGDIWYIPFTKVVYNKNPGLRTSNDDHWPYFYDCFAICFYDFKLKQVDDTGKTGEKGKPNTTFDIINENDQNIDTWVNESAEPYNLNKQISSSKTTTTSTTLSTSNTLSFTEGGSFQYSYKWGESKVGEHSITVGVNFSTTQSQTTGESRTAGESQTVTQTYSVSGPMPPATQVTVIQSTALTKGATTCSAPVTFQYKVAVLSLCGYYSGQVIGQRDVEVTHAGTCRIFGEKTGDALADVQMRYNDRQKDDFNLDWHLDPPRDPALNQERFYANLGGAVTFFITQETSKVMQPVPMFPLKATEVDKPDYTIAYSEKNPGEINLSLLEVKGKAILKNGKNEALYYGFSSSHGDWVLCDADKNPISKSDYGHIEDRPTGTYFVADKKTEPGNPVYVMYVIDQNFYPKDPTEADPKEFLTNDDLAKDNKGRLRCATISITILAEDHMPQKKWNLVDINEDQPLVTPPKELPEGYIAVQYSTDGGQTWTDTLPIGNDAGHYEVLTRYIGDGDHEDFIIDPIIVSIGSDSVYEYVNRCYRLILNREGDEEGIAYWMEELSSRRQYGASIVDAFTKSDEFIARNLDNEEIVDVFYRAMLGREPEEGGYSFWLDSLAAGYGADYLVWGFSDSDEFAGICEYYGILPGGFPRPDDPDPQPVDPDPVEEYVNRCYRLILGREGEEEGVAYWVNLLKTHAAAGADIVSGFVKSGEFTTRCLSNEEVVAVFYRTMLGREPEEGGYGFWLDGLEAGYGADYLVWGFSGSAEFREICATYGIIPGDFPMPAFTPVNTEANTQLAQPASSEEPAEVLPEETTTEESAQPDGEEENIPHGEQVIEVLLEEELLFEEEIPEAFPEEEPKI